MIDVSQLSYELSLEQQFDLRRMQDEVGRLPRDEMEKLLIKAATLLMIKDNLIRQIGRQVSGV